MVDGGTGASSALDLAINKNKLTIQTMSQLPVFSPPYGVLSRCYPVPRLGKVAVSTPTPSAIQAIDILASITERNEKDH